MPKLTKIDVVRSELSRISSDKDKEDVFSPTLRASWSYSRVLVIGKLTMRDFDYDLLLESLGRIPTGAGEAFFWNTVASAVLGENHDSPEPKDSVVVQLHDPRRMKTV